MITVQELYKTDIEFRDSRLKSLFSDFIILKESNPEGYEANISVWKRFLKKLFQSQTTLCFQYDILKKNLEYITPSGTYRPEGLYIVLNDMINNDKTIILLSELAKNTSDVRTPGVFGIIKSFIFGSSKFIDISSQKNKRESYIFKSKLQSYSEDVKSTLLPLLDDGPVNFEHLLTTLKKKNNNISQEDLNCVLLFMKNHMHNIEVNNRIIYKLPKEINSEDKEQINLGDLEHIADINYTIYKINEYLAKKIDEIHQFENKIRESIKLKNQVTARSQLKLKRNLEMQVQKTSATLENLNMMKLKVEDAHNNLLVAKIWKDNSNVLKLLNEKTVENDIDSMFNTLYDEMKNTNELSTKLGQSLSTSDDGEIESELLKLEQESHEKEVSSDKHDNSVSEIERKLNELKIPDKKPELEAKNTYEGEKDEFKIAMHS